MYIPSTVPTRCPAFAYFIEFQPFLAWLPIHKKQEAIRYDVVLYIEALYLPTHWIYVGVEKPDEDASTDRFDKFASSAAFVHTFAIFFEYPTWTTTAPINGKN